MHLSLCVLLGLAAFSLAQEYILEDLEGQDSFRHVSVGPAGIWVVTHSDKVFYREGTYMQPAQIGTAWTLVTEHMIQVDVGLDTVWAVNRNYETFVRKGINSTHPAGTEWEMVKTPEELKQISVSKNGTVWAVSKYDEVYVYKCSSDQCGWTKLPEDLKVKQISAGQAGVWALDQHNGTSYYRVGTYGDDSTLGTAWQTVSPVTETFQHLLMYISCGEEVVMGVGYKHEVYMLQGVSSAKPTGTQWVKQQTMSLRVLDVYNSSFYCGVDLFGKLVCVKSKP